MNHDATLAPPQLSSADFTHGLRVTAPGRLHIGFLDLGGALGRLYGSLGLTLDRPATRVRLAWSESQSADGPDADRAAAALATVADAFGFDRRVAVAVDEALPAHSGLGSGTQMGLAVGVGLARLNGHAASPRAIAEILGRGQRSSIGLGAFEQGGLVLDGGRGAQDAPPPILSRIAIPQAWRIVLIYDQAIAGLSGPRENAAMASLPAFPEALADRLCRLAVLGALAAASEGDAKAFGEAIGEMQRRLGDHFAQAQGGRFTSPDVAEALAVIEARGVPGVGQSSWGPTGFAILGDPIEAEALALDLGARFADRPNLVFDVARGANHGAEFMPLPAKDRRQDVWPVTGDLHVRR